MNKGIELLQQNPNEERASVLISAAEAILQDRNASYGMPEDNFADIAAMFQIYLNGLPRKELIAHDVAIFHIITKICRIKQSPNKQDHWTDIAGYTGCGYRAVVFNNHKLQIKEKEKPYFCYMCNKHYSAIDLMKHRTDFPNHPPL